MFWREGVAWVMVRCPSGQVVSLPWRWTNLPVPATQGETAAPASDAALLSPAALLGLVRHLHSRPDATISAHAPLGGPLEVRQPGAKGDNTAFRSMLERALATGPTPWALQIERVLPDLAPWDLEDYPGVRDLLCELGHQGSLSRDSHLRLLPERCGMALSTLQEAARELAQSADAEP